jgi:chromosome segregation ATPase
MAKQYDFCDKCGVSSKLHMEIQEENRELRRQLQEKQGEVERLTERLQIDPGGSDKIDELEQALKFNQYALDSTKEQLGVMTSCRDHWKNSYKNERGVRESTENLLAIANNEVVEVRRQNGDLAVQLREEKLRKSAPSSALLPKLEAAETRLAAVEGAWAKYHNENCGCNECLNCNITDCAMRELGMAFATAAPTPAATPAAVVHCCGGQLGR